MPRIAAIVQARMSSRRLPKKVLTRIQGKPLLQYLTERLARCATVDQVIVATSGERDDDPIVDFCEQAGVDCHRGPLDNVASRFVGVLERWPLDAFIRVSGDSPLIDPTLVDECVRRFETGDCDVVSNVAIRSYPAGQSVEVIGVECYRAAFGKMSTAEHFEHVTPYFYEPGCDVRRVDLTLAPPRPEVRMVVDTADDLQVVTQVVLRMTRPHWEYGLHELLALYGQVMRWPSDASASA